MFSLQTLLSHRFRRPAEPFRTITQDGVWIAGTRLGAAEPERPALVLVHGLMGWHRKPRFARFAERMMAGFTVYAPDLRGHGMSAGTCTYGDREIDDVEAVVQLARSDGHRIVLTAGASMGAISVLRHAGLIGGVDGVAAISSLAYWDWHDGAHPKTRRKMQAWMSSGLRRAMLRTWGVRLPDVWEAPESPEDVIGRIAPIPVLLVHGRNDHLFALDHAERLYAAAGEPKRLLVGERFGHAEDGLTPAFAGRLTGELQRMLGGAWRA
jgi:pimeloyl-ACP methyl ester carboxylesterase